MHIAQIFSGVVPPQGYGGVERVIYWLIKEFLSLGHRVTLVADAASQIQQELPQVRFYPFSSVDELGPKELADIDIFHFHNDVVAGWDEQYPYLVTEHGNNKRKTAYRRNTVFLSESHARNHNARFYLPNGIPLAEYPLKTEKRDEIAYMAKLNWRAKNARTAINLAFDTRTPINLTGGDLFQSRKVWGTWLLKYPFRKELIRQHGMVDGNIKLKILMDSMCLFYLVNWHEPFALAPHEALACGTPIIASPNGALNEYVRDGENGHIVHDYAQAKQSINQLRQMSANDRREMAGRCRASAYTIEDSARRHIEIYRKIMDEGFLYTAKEAMDISFRNPPIVKIRR